MTDLLDKIYELRDYDSDSAAFISAAIERIRIGYDEGALTKEECIELTEDLRQTKQVAALAERIETKILIEDILNDFLSILGAL